MASELRVGIAGLGIASKQVIDGFRDALGVRLAAAADLRKEARDGFAARHGLPVFDKVEAMCRSDAIDAVWIVTPNHLHCEHTVAAAENGKHAICAKPLAISLAESDRMLKAADASGVQILQSHCKIFESPIQAMRKVIAGGRLGRVIQIDTWLFNDWLQRPRLAEELDPALGGGVVFRQGPHLVDIVRFLGGGKVERVRGTTGRWDPHFDTEGNFSALLEFAGGVSATISFSGYGYFDSTELTWNIGVAGDVRRAGREPARRPRRTGALTEGEKFGAALAEAPGMRERSGVHSPFFGLTLVSCERGAIRQSPDGLLVYTDAGCEEVPVAPDLGRAAELIELCSALTEGRRVFPDGRWGKATLEVLLALRESARLHRGIELSQQIPVG